VENLHLKLENYSAVCDELLVKDALKKLIDEAAGAIKHICVNDLKQELQNVVLIDVREPEEFSSGYVKAKEILTIPRGKLEFVALDKIGKKYGFEQKIVLYCLKGPRGALATMQLQKLGFKNVYNLDGGLLEWLKQGNTIQSYLGELKLQG